MKTLDSVPRHASPMGALATLITVVAAFVTPASVSGQDVEAATLTEGLADAVAYYHQYATSDLKHIEEATHRFETLAISNPVSETAEGGWLPAYWTSFAYTQLSLFARDERSGPYVQLARAYLEKAAAGKPEGDKRIDADFLALEAMVLGFEQGAYPERADELDKAEDEAWEKVRATDPENPMGVMNQGLRLIQNEDTRARAYELLDRAIELYEPRMDSPLPNWGREFIDVWMGNYPRPASDSGGVHDLLTLGTEDWIVRQDRLGVGDPPRVTKSGEALRIVTGGSSILYPASVRLDGSFRLELDVSLFDPAGRNEGFGLIFGGSELSGPEIAYGYFLIRQDGMALLKQRVGENTEIVRDWLKVDALRDWNERAEGSEHVENRLAVEVSGEVARFLVNGEEVHRLSTSVIETAGTIGLRVNHGVTIEVNRFEVVRRG